MKIRLLGTGAAEGIPAFYSNSYVSRYAREHGGRDVRTRSAALIDDGLKIDLPPDTLVQMNREKLDAHDWTALLFTHSHDDHFAPAELQYCLYPFSEMDHMGFSIYANSKIAAAIRDMYPAWPMEVQETRPFQCFTHGDYHITPVLAMHADEESAQNLIVEREGEALLYATDTGIWRESTWEYLQGVRLDLLVIECTEGKRPIDYDGHLNIENCVSVVERLRTQGTLRSDSKVVTTHHSHNGGMIHSELVEALAPHGIEVGWDGLVVSTCRRT